MLGDGGAMPSDLASKHNTRRRTNIRGHEYSTVDRQPRRLLTLGLHNMARHRNKVRSPESLCNSQCIRQRQPQRQLKRIAGESVSFSYT